MAEVIMDWDRERRTGVSEAVLCAGKAPAQIDAILVQAAEAGRRVLLTRLDPTHHHCLSTASRNALDYDPLSRTGIFGAVGDPPGIQGIGIVCAGTSDLPVAREASRTLGFHGFAGPVIADVGVAGLWRLMERIETIRQFRVIIAVAGMEAALFSVLAGLVESLVIAVPSSIGYGVAEGGRAALSSALASCAPGVVTVNIDNGYGAACAAMKVVKAVPASDASEAGR